MEPTIRPKKVDLYEIGAKNRAQERDGILGIESQIVQWMRDNNLEKEVMGLKGLNILVNKLVYYISKDIRDANPNFYVSGGWYKYGPCFEQGKRGEDSFTLNIIRNIEPPKNTKPIGEVSNICEEFVELFVRSSKEYKSQFPYQFIDYIYKYRCEHEWLKDYYPAKNNLSKILYDLGERDIDPRLINRAFIAFDKAIINRKYRSKIEMSDLETDRILEFTSLLNYTAQEAEKDSYFQRLVSYFNSNIVLLYSLKNYEHTFESMNTEYANAIIKQEREEYKRFSEELPQALDKYYATRGWA